MTRLLVVEPDYCPYQAGFPSAIAAASEVIEGESQILKPFGTPRIGLICSYWQNSPAHYANITNASFTSMGVACWFCSTAEGQYTYWTVTFN